MGLKEKLIAKLWELLQSLVDKYGNFIRKPTSLISVSLAANLIIDKLLAWLKDILQASIVAALTIGLDKLLSSIFTDPANITDDQIQEYVSKHRGLQNIIQFAGNDLNERVIGDITLACTNPDYYDDMLNDLMSALSIPDRELSGNDFIDIVGQSSDFDDRVSEYYEVQRPELKSLSQKVKGILPWAFLVYIIVLKIKEFLNQNRYPSKYRGKYLVRLIRVVTAILKTSAQRTKVASEETITNISNQATGLINELIDTLKSLDKVIAGILFAYLVYEFNRKLLQDNSFKELNDSVGLFTCDSSIPIPFLENTSVQLDGSIIFPQDLINFSCPIDLDNIPSIHVPIEDKQFSFSCPIPQETIASLDLGPLGPSSPDTATKAIYSNLGSTPFTPLISPGDSVSTETPLLINNNTIKPITIYSSINGIVESIINNGTSQEILIKNISDDAAKPELEKNIKDFSLYYQDLKNTKSFLTTWYIRSILPCILQASPMMDASVYSMNWADIVYKTGGAEGRYQRAYNSSKTIKGLYEEDISNTVGKDQVEQHAKNETLYIIKENFDLIESTYYESLNRVGLNAISQGKQTQIKKSEYLLIEWYLQLYEELLLAIDDKIDLESKINVFAGGQQPLEDKYLINFTKEISTILIKRTFVDEYKIELIIEKINLLCYELDKGNSLTYNSLINIILDSSTKEYDNQNYYQVMREKMLSIWKTESPSRIALKTTSDFISQLGTSNRSLSTEQKNLLRWRIYSLFYFAQTVAIMKYNEYSTEETPFEATDREATSINNFFNDIWRNLETIPENIENLIKKLDKNNQTYLTPNIIYRNGEPIRLYAIGNPRKCPEPVLPGRLSPFSEHEFSDIKYWLKYCAYATLASVVGFPLTWSTGLITPVGPIPFPTVYIPVKAFQLAWGVLVIGITLTGIYPFPWIMIANMSNHYHVPLVDPATAIQKNIDKLKSVLSIQLKEFKQELLVKAMNKAKEEVEFWEGEIERISEAQRQLKLNKPKRNREEEAFGDKIKALAIYTDKISKWTITRVALVEEKLEAKRKRWVASIKFDILYRASGGNKVSEEDNLDPEILVIQKAEENIDKQFSKLNQLINSIDVLLAGLPISTEGGSASFGITIKSPKPITKMADGLNETIDEGILSKIQKPFDLNREDLMSTNYGSKLDKSFINGKNYMNKIAASSMALIPVDPFPKYELLVPQNLAWTVKFLLPSWAKTGAAMYGIPGFPPPPIGNI